MEGASPIAITVRLMNGVLGGNVTEVTVTLRTEDGTAACKFNEYIDIYTYFLNQHPQFYSFWRV